jgi:trehalose/maltose hydrolase-like predicted phosphorylase
MALVYGFAGMRGHHGVLSVRPRRPDDWRRLRRRLTVRGNLFEVDVRSDATACRLKGAGIILFHQGAERRLPPGGRAAEQPTRPCLPQS